MESGNEGLFIEVIKILKDIKERVILMKNIEAFSEDAVSACLPFDKIILSGNLDACVAKDKIIKKVFNSTVIFTKPTTVSLPIEIPVLEKWTGYLSTKSLSGVIKVIME